MKLGTNDIGSVYLGTNAVQKVYLGTNEVWSSYAYLLDDYPNAAAAYSLRLLRSAYTGSAIRVRRASDNTEQDIGFVDNELDTSTLTSFCSGTNGFVKTWYDQSGNGNDATQTTAANQPQIVSSGSVILENGKPSVQFDGNNDGLVKNVFSITGTQAVSSFTIGYGVESFNTGIFTINGSIGGADAFIQTTEVGVRTGGGFAKFGTQSPSTISLVTMLSPTNANISDVTCYINSISSSRTGISDNNIDFGSTTDMGIGYSFINNFDGIVSEILLYGSDQSSNRTGIETNINDFYSIY